MVSTVYSLKFFLTSESKTLLFGEYFTVLYYSLIYICYKYIIYYSCF